MNTCSFLAEENATDTFFQSATFLVLWGQQDINLERDHVITLEIQQNIKNRLKEIR